MISILVQLAGGVAALVYILIGRTLLSEVALKDTHKQAPFEKRRFSDVINAIATSIIALLLLPLTLIPNLLAMVSTQFVSNFKWYVLFFAIAGVAVSWNNIDNEVITTIDQLITEFGPPFYEDFVKPIGNALRSRLRRSLPASYWRLRSMRGGASYKSASSKKRRYKACWRSIRAIKDH